MYIYIYIITVSPYTIIYKHVYVYIYMLCSNAPIVLCRYMFLAAWYLAAGIGMLCILGKLCDSSQCGLVDY